MPKDLSFSAEMNENWHMDSNNNLHYMKQDALEIEPGKTNTVKLVLIKTLNNNSAGTIENIAEIAESSNLDGLKEQNSIAGNKDLKEDDISTANLIISIKTGSPGMYIAIVLISLTILGTGIYLINKRIIRGGI